MTKGWTKRKEVLTSYEGIISYLDKENNFHDYRIGNIEHTASETMITVEEVIPGVKVEDSAGPIWDFHFKGVTFFEMMVDVVLGFWIMDVDRGEKPNEISFSLLSGIIHVAAEQIELGIPSQEN